MLSVSHSMGWQQQATLNTDSPCISVQWVNASKATLTDIGLHTLRPCFPKPPLLSSAGKRKVCDRFDTGLSHRKRRTDVIFSMPSFCSHEPEGISSLSLMPQIQRIMAQSLRRCCCRSKLFGQTQASYTLPHILGERYLAVRTDQSYLNFPRATQHLAAMAPEYRVSHR